MAEKKNCKWDIFIATVSLNESIETFSGQCPGKEGKSLQIKNNNKINPLSHFEKSYNSVTLKM